MSIPHRRRIRSAKASVWSVSDSSGSFWVLGPGVASRRFYGQRSSGRLGVCCRRRFVSQQLLRKGELVLGPSAGPQPEVAQLDESRWQYVQQEATDKLVGTQRDASSAFGGETDSVWPHRPDALIRETRAVRVPSQILEDPEGPLGVDDPVGPIQLGEQRRHVLPIAAQDALVQQLAQSVQKQAAKQLRHHQHRKQVPGSAVHKATAVLGQTSGGHDAVQVRVIIQLARPGVQHRRDAQVRAEPLGVVSQLQQRLGRRGKKQSIHLPIIAPAQPTQRGGQREDHVEVRDRQQLLFARRDPLGLLETLALGTVPIATRIVRRAAVAAVVADLQVTPERRRPAPLDGAHHFCLLLRQHVLRTIYIAHIGDSLV